MGAPGTVLATSYCTVLLVEPEKAAPVVGVKTAVSESLPSGQRGVVTSCAAPLTTVTGLPTASPSLSNCTVPGALTSVTVAFNVTEVPDGCGLAGVGVASVVVVSAGGE